ncbi:MAG: wax ester/triacylglycerol synthase family O-acyltransferase [Candidatus Binatia bacterium]
MLRLSGADALFIYTETPALHTHTLKVAIIDPTVDPAGYSFPREREYIAQRVRHVPPLRWRLLPAPFGLYHPLWIEDREVDFEFHIRRVAAPSPGGARELGDIIAEIASRPLDREHPLWETWMVEGLEGGKVAAVLKLHHAVADGPASVVLLEQLLSANGVEPSALQATSGPPDRVPPRGVLMRMALAELLAALGTGALQLGRYIWGVTGGRVARRTAASDAAAKPFTAPRTSFNGIISGQRRFAFCSVPLADAKAVRAAFGVTINDVVLATVGGALERYLRQRQELPERPLVAAVPVSVRSEGGRTNYGNKSSVWYVNLPPSGADPVARLQAIHGGTERAKREHEDTTGAHLSDLLELLPPFVLRLLFVRAVNQMQRRGAPPHANVIVSNVRGPSDRLYFSGQPLDAFYSVGPLLEGIGLNITTWSYVNQLNFSLLADRNLVGDVWQIADGLRPALDELVQAARARTASAG